MKIRLAVSSDFPHCVALQNQNMVGVLSPKEQQAGCLLRAFSLEDFEYMHQSLGVYVSVQGGKVCGYLCANSLEPRLHSGSTLKLSPESLKPVEFRLLFMQRIFEQTQKILYQGKLLAEYVSFIPSPMCIVREYRGSRLFLDLCNTVLRAVSPPEDPEKHYELAITLVSVNNARSLQSCLAIAFEIVDTFYVGQYEYFLLVCDLRKTDRKTMNLGVLAPPSRPSVKASRCRQ